jgi:hypothetical protein
LRPSHGMAASRRSSASPAFTESLSAPAEEMGPSHISRRLRASVRRPLPGGPWNRTTGISRPTVETIPIAPPVLLPGDAQLPDRERPGEPDSVGCHARRTRSSRPSRLISYPLVPRPARCRRARHTAAYPGRHTGTSPAR